MKPKAIALSGLIGALSILFLWLASVIPGSRMAIAAMSAFALEFLFQFEGKRAGTTTFVVVSTAVFLMLPVKSLAVLYLLYFGGYVAFRQYASFNNKTLSWFLKLSYLNGVTVAVFLLANTFFSDIFGKLIGDQIWHIFVLFFVLQFIWIIVDNLLCFVANYLIKMLAARGIKK
jgi:hypothetical protein